MEIPCKKKGQPTQDGGKSFFVGPTGGNGPIASRLGGLGPQTRDGKGKEKNGVGPGKKGEKSSNLKKRRVNLGKGKMRKPSMGGQRKGEKKSREKRGAPPLVEPNKEGGGKRKWT